MSRIPLGDLAEFCRLLRSNLSAGLGLARVLRQLSERGPASIRPLARRLDEAVRSGESVSDALEREASRLPPLFVALVKVGEETGGLPEILRELEKYFMLELKLQRQFRSRTMPTIIQFVFATLVVAGLLWILGMLASAGQRPLMTFLGLGGGLAALAFLGVVFGSILAVYLAYRAARQLLRQRAAADRLLLNLPVIGPCLDAIAMSRFVLALQLTLDSGLAIAKALRLSLQATANAAYADRSAVIVQTLKSGQSLHEALERSGLFSPDFLNIVASAEEGGRVPEMMRHQVEFYQEETERRLTALTRAATGAVWLGYAGFMIWMIMRIAGVYLGALGGR